MKRCPSCHRVENDNSLSFCRVDGTALISDASAYDGEAQTVQLGSATSPEVRTTLLDPKSFLDRVSTGSGSDLVSDQPAIFPNDF